MVASYRVTLFPVLGAFSGVFGYNIPGVFSLNKSALASQYVSLRLLNAFALIANLIKYRVGIRVIGLCRTGYVIGGYLWIRNSSFQNFFFCPQEKWFFSIFAVRGVLECAYPSNCFVDIDMFVLCTDICFAIGQGLVLHQMRKQALLAYKGNKRTYLL